MRRRRRLRWYQYHINATRDIDEPTFQDLLGATHSSVTIAHIDRPPWFAPGGLALQPNRRADFASCSGGKRRPYLRQKDTAHARELLLRLHDEFFDNPLFPREIARLNGAER